MFGIFKDLKGGQYREGLGDEAGEVEHVVDGWLGSLFDEPGRIWGGSAVL